MTIEAIFQLYEIAVSTADTLGGAGPFGSEEDCRAQERDADAAMAEVERLQALLVSTPCAALPGIAGKLRVALKLARESDSAAFPEWRLIESALRDMAQLVTVTVTNLVPETVS